MKCQNHRQTQTASTMLPFTSRGSLCRLRMHAICGHFSPLHCEASLKDRQAMLCEYHPGCPQHTPALLLTLHRADYRVDKTTELVPTDVEHTHLAERGQTLPQAAMLCEPHTRRALSERPGQQTAHSSPGAQQDPRAPLPPS